MCPRNQASLAKDEAFLKALRPVLRNRNARLPPNEALTIQDLIAIDKDFAKQPSLLGESDDHEKLEIAVAGHEMQRLELKKDEVLE